METSTNGYIYKILLYLRFREDCELREAGVGGPSVYVAFIG